MTSAWRTPPSSMIRSRSASSHRATVSASSVPASSSPPSASNARPTWWCTSKTSNVIVGARRSVPGGAVDDVPQRLPAREPAEVVGEELQELLRVAVLRCRRVGRDPDPGSVPQGVVGGKRLLPGDVEDRPAEVTRSQRGDQRRFVDERPAADVAEQRTGLHRRERGLVEEVLGLLGPRRADDHRVAAGEHVVQIGGAAELVDRRVLLTGLVAPARPDGRHAEGAGAERDLRADRAQPDDPQGEPFDQGAEARLPVARALLLVDLVEPLPDREQPPQRELRDRRGRDTGGIGDHAPLRELHAVEMVDPGPDRLHPAQTGRELADVLREIERERRLRARPHRALGVAELVGAVREVMTETPEVRLGDDLQGREPVPHRPEERVVDVPRVGDDDAHARTSLSTPGAWMGASVDVRYSGASGVSTNQPVGHIVRISTKEKPSPASWVSSARRTIFLVRATLPALFTAPRAT